MAQELNLLFLYITQQFLSRAPEAKDVDLGRRPGWHCRATASYRASILACGARSKTFPVILEAGPDG